jgi:hypothetical protein
MAVFIEKPAVTSSKCYGTLNKRAIMALDRSPVPTHSSEQLPTQAF